MIDIHNHLLSGIDDGPEDTEESLRMCRIAVEDGISIIVATPHLFNGINANDPEKIRSLVSDLNRDLQPMGIPLEILPGMEIQIAPNIMDLLSLGKLMTINDGRYFLIELPIAHIPAALDKFVRHLRSKNYGIIIGHPEKNVQIQRRPDWLVELLSHLEPWDLLVQISADSLTGAAGRAPSVAARYLLKKNAVHIIASDAHAVIHRPPKLSGALKEAERIVGEARAYQMVTEIPMAVLKDADFPALEPINPPKKWWHFWMKE